jgi:hypothetical protein
MVMDIAVSDNSTGPFELCETISMKGIAQKAAASCLAIPTATAVKITGYDDFLSICEIAVHGTLVDGKLI